MTVGGRMKDLSRYDYEERAAAQDPDDYWGQVRRTINGKPVGEDQIVHICNAVKRGLDLNLKDNLIDVGCGNGALTYRFKDNVNRIIGIDRSEYLLSVAKEKFAADNIEYLIGDVLSVLKSVDELGQYNKALLYGVISYFSDELVATFIEDITYKKDIKKIFIGNVRDRTLADKFYKRHVSDDELDMHTSSMGKWRFKEYFIELGKQFKWDVEFSKMPEDFYAYEYHFDVIMSR